MLTLTLAWRSFLRHRRRSIITVMAVALGLAMMLFFVGFGDDAHKRMADMGIRLGAGHVLVQGRGYQEQQTLSQRVHDPERVVAEAKRLKAVEHVAPRVLTSGLIQAAEHSRAVLVAGVDPALEPKLSDIASKKGRVLGAYLRPRSKLPYENQPADIYLGETLAKTLGVQLGDRVVLSASPDGQSEPRSAAFLVRGMFRTGVSELDSAHVEIPLRESQKLLDLGNSVTQVALLLREGEDPDAVADELTRSLSDPTLEVLPWTVALAELHEAIVLDEMGMYLMMAIIFVIVGIGIFNTVLMSVSERTREFGVMMALGTSRWRIFSLITCEALVLAASAALLGLALGLSMHFWVARHGIDMTALAGGEDYQFSGIALSGRFYSTLGPGTVVLWTIVVVLMVLISALYPAFRATRFEPVEAMRHV